ncbi:ribonuclease R [bacterium]|nr:ribonuclease R [bacterium]
MSQGIRKKYEKKVIQFLDQHPKKCFKTRMLSRELGVQNRDYRAFRELLKFLTESGKVSRYKGNQFGKYVKPAMLTGKLHVKAQGYGFLIREDGGEDVFISQKSMGSALHGDCIRVELWAHSAGKLPEGKVREVLERGRDRLVGVYVESNAYSYVVPDDFKVTRDIYIAPDHCGSASPGHKVIAEIVDWGEAARMPEGRIVEVLGYPDEPGVDVLSIASEFNLPSCFSDKVENAAASLSEKITREEIDCRLDCRDWLTFTIDPEDAKDFDDAVSLVSMENGNYQLGVHIADVSAFVKMGSPVDHEALSRGTSVYLVDRVFPMLPERLSNQLCSLKPRADRLAFSVLFELTPGGGIIDYQIKESLIQSKIRLSYIQAQKILDAPDSSFRDLYQEFGINESNEIGLLSFETLCQTLKQMHALSQILFENWQEQGYIDFDAPEPDVQLDDKGKPVALGVRARYDSHRLIESFMLLANQTVAGHIRQIRQSTGKKYPFIYRVHQKPTQEKMKKFMDFVRPFGYEFDPGKKVTSKKFQQFLNGISDPGHRTVIDEVAVRTMMKAIYSTANTGHFGLAFKDYTHFTSPIRRYPDLMVHRLLKSYLQTDPQKLNIKPTLAQIAAQSTEREIVAQEAERESIRAKQVDFMSDHLGAEFDGIISGVTSFGFFVEITELLVEGLVAVRDLQDDYYVYDEKRWRLKGEMTGRIYQLGDPVRVQVVRVHREMRKLDFVLVDAEDQESKVKRKKKNRRGRRPLA